METVIKDAQYCLNIINGYCISKRGIGKIYRNTNEDLSKIITKQDIKGKTILSVLASSDQVLSCYYLGAKSVDTFDSNKLTLLLFFLKKMDNFSNRKILYSCFEFKNFRHS